MKQAEFQDCIEWLDGMNYCAIDEDGLITQFEAMPLPYISSYNGKFCWDNQTETQFHQSDDIEELILVIEPKDPENWCFKKSGEMY